MSNTILIVDDEADIVSTLADYFLYNDYNVMTATSGMEAIEKAGKKPVLILLDINMPDVDGLEVCARIRGFVSCPIRGYKHQAQALFHPDRLRLYPGTQAEISLVLF